MTNLIIEVNEMFFSLPVLPIAFIDWAFVGMALLYMAISLAISAGLNILLSEDPKGVGPAASIEVFNFPTTTQGRVIQIIFGSPRMKGYNDLWHGGLQVSAINEKVKKNIFGNHKDITVGYRYYMGLHYGWCAFAEELIEMRMDEQVFWNFAESTDADGVYWYIGLRPFYHTPYYLDDRGQYIDFFGGYGWRLYQGAVVLYTNPSMNPYTLPLTGWLVSAGTAPAPTFSCEGGYAPAYALGSGGGSRVLTNTSLDIYKEGLFGGDASQGGVGGTFSVMFGGPTQPANTYLLAQDFADGGNNPVPAFRGIVTTVSEGMHIGNTTSLKTMDAIWRRTTKTNRGEEIWYAEKAEIDFGDGLKHMNIAHIVHEIITDPDYSLGFVGGVDYDTPEVGFIAVADTLYDEGFGLSLVLDVAKNGAKILSEIVGYANGFLRVDSTTNKFQIKLMRDDFDVDDLDIIDGSIISEITRFSREEGNERYNQVSITYTDPDTREPATIIAQNTALISAYGVISDKSLSGLPIHTPSIANRVATTTLRTLGLNPFKIELKGNRELAQYNLGDPMRIQMPEDGLDDVIVRVIEADYGNLLNGEVSLIVTQDIFKTDVAVFGDSGAGSWFNDGQWPTELVNKKIIELPYYVLANEIMSPSIASTLITDTGRPMISAARTLTANSSFDVWSKLSTDTYYGVLAQAADFAPYCTLASNIGKSINQITVGYENGIDMDGMTVDETSWCAIEEEILKIIEIDTVAEELTLERGCLDTLPADHASGAGVFFMSNTFIASNNEYNDGQTLNIKLLPRTLRSQMELDDVSADNITMNQRYIRPYNAGNFRGSVSGEDIDFEWEHRNRTTQVQSIVLQDATGITPEDGITYTLTVFDDTVEVREIPEIADDEFTYVVGDRATDFGLVGTGTASPDYTGVYLENGEEASAPKYEDATSSMWYDGTTYWYITALADIGNTGASGFQKTTRTGTFAAVNGATGSIDVAVNDEFAVYKLKAIRTRGALFVSGTTDPDVSGVYVQSDPVRGYFSYTNGPFTIWRYSTGTWFSERLWILSSTFEVDATPPQTLPIGPYFARSPHSVEGAYGSEGSATGTAIVTKGTEEWESWQEWVLYTSSGGSAGITLGTLTLDSSGTSGSSGINGSVSVTLGALTLESAGTVSGGVGWVAKPGAKDFSDIFYFDENFAF